MNFFKKIKSNTKPELPQSREYNRFKKIKIVNLFSLFILLGTFVTTAYFVYNNVYKTLGQLDTLAIVNNIKNFEAINFKNYEDAVAAWDNKNQDTKELQISRDLFNKTLILPTSTTQFATTTDSN
ncbi:MAG: hypothetical protein COX80_03500 [Candidatus Magasanikbacteria bacterium CG_4_10_14_0_2_um_filter_33_14]|uniref:Uncharacterized protein n=1 Tax=Candidatus Magasanikbacteria bacterium CG_4_10_14_0_2_um_filter_33_14 TaxID=1974636 RepID=A0A2M7VA88_9BACT|nr:MAG: hypothetical protein COX80_03500 [Candidatus Magasanikbacteria bacterium CG_4_10_14_0_2_um_filter_33_14]